MKRIYKCSKQINKHKEHNVQTFQKFTEIRSEENRTKKAQENNKCSIGSWRSIQNLMKLKRNTRLFSYNKTMKKFLENKSEKSLTAYFNYIQQKD